MLDKILSFIADLIGILKKTIDVKADKAQVEELTKNRIIKSKTPPEDINAIWLDNSETTETPRVLKRWDNTKWAIINEVNVGGRNLVLDSDVEHTSNANTIFKYKFSPFYSGILSNGSGYLFKDQLYAVTICLTPADDVTHIAPHLAKGFVSMSHAPVVKGGGKQIVKFVFRCTYPEGKTPQDNAGNALMYMNRFPKATESSKPTTIHWVKVETATKHSDYTRAPEDIEGQLSNKADKTHTHAYLPLSGGTVNGNINAQYLTGTWLQTTASTHSNNKAEKIAIIDNSGWIYYRTPTELLDDIGAKDGNKKFELIQEYTFTSSDVQAGKKRLDIYADLLDIIVNVHVPPAGVTAQAYINLYANNAGAVSQICTGYVVDGLRASGHSFFHLRGKIDGGFADVSTSQTAAITACNDDRYEARVGNYQKADFFTKIIVHNITTAFPEGTKIEVYGVKK